MLSFIRNILIYISICMQAQYLTQRFSLTGQPCVRVRLFSAISVRPIHIVWTFSRRSRHKCIFLYREWTQFVNIEKIDGAIELNFLKRKIILSHSKFFWYVYMIQICCDRPFFWSYFVNYEIRILLNTDKYFVINAEYFSYNLNQDCYN